MIVKFKKDTPVHRLVRKAGSSLEVEDDLGTRLCAQGYADPVRESRAETADAPPTKRSGR